MIHHQRAVRILQSAGAVVLMGLAALNLAGTRATAQPAAKPSAAPASEFAGADLKRGAEIYARVCAQCHDAGVERAPSRSVLSFMTAQSIHAALTTGPMVPMAAMLSAEDKRAVAFYAADQSRNAPPSAPVKTCARSASGFDMRQPPEFDGWGLAAGNSHAIPTALAGIDRASASRLKLKWALAFPHATRARSQPAFAGGAIFVGSQDGTVFALDRETGCARWQFKARAEVRTGIVVSPWKKGDAAARPALYFGDLIGNAYALDLRTGRQLWVDKTDPNPSVTLTGTPTLHKGTIYVPVSSRESATAREAKFPCCKFRGSVVAYDARSGKRLWQTFTTDEPKPAGVNALGVPQFAPSGAAIWSTPTVDPKRGLLYVTTGNNYTSPATKTSDAVMALDLVSGAVRWSTQVMSDPWNGSCHSQGKENCPANPGLDYDLGTGAVLTRGRDGREYLLAGQKSGAVHAFDPDGGAVVWHSQLGRGGPHGGVHFGIAAEGGSVFVPISDAEIAPNYVDYSAPKKSGMYALDVATGKTLWASAAPDVCAGRKGCMIGYSGAISATPELVLTGATDGWLRVFDRDSGKVLWEYDTFQPVTAVNGDIARGGSIDGTSAPVAHRGLLVATSGYYAGSTQAPGNALLVFEVARAGK